MKKTRKILAMAACAILLVCISVGATVAYLTSTDSVTNTFTVGKVAITLDEAKVDVNGAVVTPAERVEANTYKLMPGHSYVKDPTVHFAAGSEASWLFVKVENGISTIEGDYDGETDIEQQIQNASNGWTELLYIRNEDDEVTATVYYKKVDANTTNYAIDYKVFDGFKIMDDIEAVPSDPSKKDVDKTYLDDFSDKRIVVTAYAVQQDGFATAKEAWDATFGKSTSSEGE